MNIRLSTDINVKSDVVHFSGLKDDEYSVSLLSAMLLLSLKYYSEKIEISSIYYLLGNVYQLKYNLDRIFLEATSQAPSFVESVSESLVFLEMSSLIILDDNKKVIELSDRGLGFLNNLAKSHKVLNKEFKVALEKLKRDGLVLI